MKKSIRKLVKDEKRIVKLMYIKGILKAFKIKPEQLSWELCYCRKQDVPEIMIYFTDYWGEGDSYSIIDSYFEQLYLTTGFYNEETTEFVSENKINSREKLIKHLISLPTVLKNSKINKYLKVKEEW